jgi:hypothetical protein
MAAALQLETPQHLLQMRGKHSQDQWTTSEGAVKVEATSRESKHNTYFFIFSLIFLFFDTVFWLRFYSPLVP